VLERWIAPSLFRGTDAQDEYSLCRALGSEEASKRLMQHRETFITEAHIRQIKELGLEVVRVPVGYWLLEDVSPFVEDASEYIDKLFSWTDEHGLGVILDFHAAPGSQNGWDHSGRSGRMDWPQADNIAKSLQFVDQLTERYGQQPSLIGVEPLNEPHWDVPLNTLVQYYVRADGIVKQNCHTGVKMIVSDAFRAPDMSKALRKAKLDVTLDVHLYQLFTPEDRALNLEGHLRKADKQWRRELKKLARHHGVVVGEWSAAMSELYNRLGEAQHTYDVAGYRQYSVAQQTVFEQSGVSWTYWTARTEDGGIWSLLDHPDLLK